MIGGANLAGGVGGAGGAVIGAALIEVIRNGFVLIGANAYWEEVFVGVIIVIAVLVGGIDILMAIVITISIARSTAPPQHPGHRDRAESRDNVVAGSVSMVCVNCMSVPLCLVGATLGFVALFVHRGYNHVFTWIGLIGNLVVILGDIFLYALVMFDR